MNWHRLANSQRAAMLLMVSISCCLSMLIVANAEQVSSGASRVLVRSKRQTPEDREPLANARQDEGPAGGNPIRSSSSTSASQARSSSMATSTVLQSPRSRKPQVAAATATAGTEDDDEPEQPPGMATGSDGPSPNPDVDLRPPANNKRPIRGKGKKKPTKRPQNGDDGRRGDCDYDDDDDDDDTQDEDDEYDDGSNDYRKAFNGMVRNPMRQFSQMVGSALNRMQGAYDYYDGNGSGNGNGFRALSMANGDGYSKAVGSVTNNGRTNGIVSESSNGRTTTRRFGPRNRGRGGYDDNNEDN